MRGLTALVTVLGVSAALTACGGGSSPKVAQLGSGAETTAPQSSSNGPSPDQEAELEKYAECMRSHGIGDFPDPQSGPAGGFGFKIQAGPGSDLDPQSTRYTAADTACKALLPNGGVRRQLTAAQQQAFLNWAACIRAHGEPNLPDPIFSGGGIRIRLAAPAGQGGSGPQGPPPELQAAQQACQSKLPGGFGGLGG